MACSNQQVSARCSSLLVQELTSTAPARMLCPSHPILSCPSLTLQILAGDVVVTVPENLLLLTLGAEASHREERETLHLFQPHDLP